MRELPGSEVVKWTLSRCGTYIRSLVDDWMYAPSCSCRGCYSTVRGAEGGREEETKMPLDPIVIVPVSRRFVALCPDR